MKLTNLMKKAITDHIVRKIEMPRESALAQREHALAIRIVRSRFGEDVFERCRALPEGWLQHQKMFSLEYKLAQRMPRTRMPAGHNQCSLQPRPRFELADYAPLPMCAQSPWEENTIKGKLFNELHDLFTAKVELIEQLAQLRVQITATLSAFTTVEKLVDGWPEGYAELPQELLAQTGGVPAPRIADLNERIAALRQAA